MVLLRSPKESALRFAGKMAPLYAEVLHELKADGGRVVMQTRVAQIRRAVGRYVVLYEDERRIGLALMKGLLGEQGFDEFEREAAQFSEEETEQFLKQLLDPDELDALNGLMEIPDTEQGWKEADKAYLALSPDEQAEYLKQGSLLWAGVFGGLFNMLSLMVHGAKLTTLVPQALAGDDDAFLKAVQIDRCLMTHHPLFIERKQRAQDMGDTPFLRALGYREANPIVRGRIRYPALYMLFGALEASRWLDDLKHEELLDLCDSAQLDRYQNRIEDVNYLTKRLLEYQHWKKTGGLSMH